MDQDLRATPFPAERDRREQTQGCLLNSKSG